MPRDIPVPYPHKWIHGKDGHSVCLNRGLCIICGTGCKGRRKTFCSKKCEQIYWGHYVWGGISRRIIKRDNHTCQDCGWKAGMPVPKRYDPHCFTLQAHHIMPIKEGGKSIDSNLITLCELCHIKWHKRGLKQTTTLGAFF